MKILSRNMKPSVREALTGYFFVSIWVIGFGIFTLAPLIETFRYSINQVTIQATGIDMIPVEWANYTRALFTDPSFLQLLIEYVIETLVSVPIVMR